MPDAKKTPGIRAGVVPNSYSFAMPEDWSERPLSGPLTGNFCMPRCDEPWTEFKFEGKEGSAQLVVTDLQKLGSKGGAKLSALGTPEQVVLRVGNFITGTYLEEDDVVSAEAAQLNGRDFYVYEVATLYSKTPGHSLAAFTTKGDLAYLFVVSTSEKQWGASQGALRKVLDSFKV
ncbi:psbP domain-containing chloroplastic [Chlorella sorokiniana]|uniref:PsbP domain-containing chloroplastic n=1 Tax=Chlorella sorokiniana TaxID=3076 RepID=A0A2P6TK03_CHLSO|nr:psbP domain-containing chloroplastic [Chlorella sorokiniana]|eukprot:PRW44405.1 psbP domain-containing chloroplastic [Chlorella sorokiniana]